jgi:acetoin utilization deacetylase AcuC-like enzyme
MVFRWCHDHQIPVQCSMGGGYSPQLRTIVSAHANTYRMADHIYF